MDRYLLFLGCVVLTLFAVILGCTAVDVILNIYRDVLEARHIARLY